MDNLKIITFLWGEGYSVNNVNILKNMVKRHLHMPHEFICITDKDSKDFDSDIKIIPIWDDYLPTLSGFENLKLSNNIEIQQKFLTYYYTIVKRKPHCFRRLKLFSEEAKDLIGGEYFLWLDLDCLIVDDITNLIPSNIDFKIWRSKHGTWQPYNGSMVFNKIGTRTQLWNDFDINKSPLDTWKSGYQGSDQAWIAYKLGKNEQVWSNKDGIISYLNDILGSENKDSKTLQTGTKIIFFHGRGDKPWTENISERYPWIKDNYY